MVKRKFLISYQAHNRHCVVAGRFYNEREDDSLPSEEEITSMETKVMRNNDFCWVCIMAISEVAV